MGTRDPRVDAYIESAADFAQPILKHIREVVHKACPEIEETIKWGVPSFEYQGLLCHMAAFKGHCALGFWKHAMLFGQKEAPKRGMGSFGRITEKRQLPNQRELTRLIKEAKKLNAAGVTTVREKGLSKPKIAMHPDFKSALARKKKALSFFEGLAPSYKRDYLEWIADAKRDSTREKRIKDAVQWLSEGKRRNWKYENC